MSGIKLLFIMVLLIIIIGSCRVLRQNDITSCTFADGSAVIHGVACTDSVLQPIDSRAVGLLLCNDKTFTYDFGKYAYEGPMDAFGLFGRSLQAYHYSRFFEKLGMEERLFKALRAKITLLDVMPKFLSNDTTMWDCAPCNMVATLQFEGHTFYYPYTEADHVLDISRDTLVEGAYTYVYFQDKGSSEVGLTILPRQPMSEFYDKLTIVSQYDNDMQGTLAILKQIRMK